MDYIVSLNTMRALPTRKTNTMMKVSIFDLTTAHQHQVEMTPTVTAATASRRDSHINNISIKIQDWECNT
jgi:hypothetical protein